MSHMLEIKHSKDDKGVMGIIDSPDSIPFKIKRVLYITNIKGKRGGHSHKLMKQILICLNGSCEVYVTNGEYEKTFILDSPEKALYLDPKDWHTMDPNEDNTIILALGSEYYNEEDYVYEKPKIN